MSDEIPQWAFYRMYSLVYEESKGAPQNLAYTRVGHAFARYIMQHEDPPVDKDVLAVREILAEASNYAGSDGHSSYMSGANDCDEHFQDALAAYRKHKQ